MKYGLILAIVLFVAGSWFVALAGPVADGTDPERPYVSWVDYNQVPGQLAAETMALGDPLKLTGIEQTDGYVTYYQVLSKPVGMDEWIDPNGNLGISFSPPGLGIYYLQMMNSVRSPFPNRGVFSTLAIRVVDPLVPSTRWFRHPLPDVDPN
jgi:hypothetical protein